MAIVFNDPGLSPGFQAINESLGVLRDVIGKRSEQKRQAQQQQKGMEVMSNWASTYDTSMSPMDNISTLTEALKNSGVSSKIAMPLVQDMVKKNMSQQGDIFGAQQIFGQQQSPSPADDRIDISGQQGQSQMSRFGEEQLVQLAANKNPIVSGQAKAEMEKRKLDQQKFESDRKYHTQFATKQEEKVASLREAIPKKESALRNARQAIESGQVGILSQANLSEITGIEALQSARGSQLVTAGKENLLSNIGRMSAKGQNIWMEQRIASMFAGIGKTAASNLTFNEMLEAEVAMDKAYMKKFDELAADDESLYGYQRKDLDRRARRAVEHVDELTFDRSAYRIQRLDESEKSNKELNKMVGKKVPSGTYLTMEMAARFINKYGSEEKAADIAKKLGYTIPNGEELQLYMLSPSEFLKKVESL